MKKASRNIIIFLAFAIALIVVEWLVYSAISGTWTFDVFGQGLFWLVYAVIVVIFIGVSVYRILMTWESRQVLKANQNLDDSRWLTTDDVYKADNLKITSLKKISGERGIPVYARARKNDIDIILAQPSHVLVIGTTGSGKTSGYIEPTIELLSRTEEKPSLIISDIKGELIKHRAHALRARGYKIKIFDVAEPYRSTKWNPFSTAIRLTDEIKSCELNGEEKAIFEQERRDRIFEELKDVVDTICVVESKSDPGWEKTAKDFILGVVLIMQQKYEHGEITKENFTLYNLYRNVLLYTGGALDELTQYVESGESTVQIALLLSTVLVSESKTLSSYLGEINKYMAWLADNGVCACTSADEMDLRTIDEEPTAVFIITPETRETRNKLVALFLTQAYKALVDKATENVNVGRTSEQVLLRTTHFIMDEFGNLPELKMIDKIITAGRSRKIFFQAVIQDYAQLESKYGKNRANIIKSNCNVKVFIGSNDSATIKEISEQCGKQKVKNVSYGSRTHDSQNVNVGATERPLIHPTELMRLNDYPKTSGNAIVLMFGKFPLRATFTPIFKATGAYGETEEAVEIKGQERYFDESKYYARLIKKKDGGTSSPNASANGGEIKAPAEKKKDNDVRRAYTEIDEMLKKFENKIDVEEYTRLRQMSVSEKIESLNRLAKMAQENGKRLLGIEFAKTAILIKSNYGYLEKGEKTKNE